MKQIAELGIMQAFRERLPDKPCPHCGKTLHQRTHIVQSGNLVYLPIYEECDCEGATRERQEAAAAKAEAERQHAENIRQNTLHARMLISGIRKRYADRTLDTYRVPPGDVRAYKVALNYVKKFDEQRKKGMGLYLSGECGVGKTHLAYGIALALIGQLHRVICQSATDIMLEFRGQMDGAATGSEYETMRRYQTCDLLVIDDLGKQQVTDWSLAQLYTILDGRCLDMRPVIVTTNYTDTALVDRLALKSDRETAASIVSRLHQMAYDVMVSGEDYRSR